MNAEDLRALQTPIKERYKTDPGSAVQLLRAVGKVNPGSLQCVVPTHAGDAAAGLHPAAGGDGTAACSGEMLLEALVACAGVTLSVVATAMSIPLRSAEVTAEAELDFRGTLGVARDIPIGLGPIQLSFDLETDATTEQVDKLLQLTERYCVIYQTLKNPPPIALVKRGS